MPKSIELLGGEVVLCHPGDPRLGLAWEFLDDKSGGFEQGVGDPVMLVISGQTSDDKCARLAARFGVESGIVIAFRDGEGSHHG